MKESEMQIALNKKTGWLKAYSLAWKFIDLVYPPQCICCGKIGYRCCPDCWGKRILYNENICQKCGKPLPKKAVCSDCKTSPSPINRIRSLGEYNGVLRSLILALKYQRDIGLAEMLLPDLAQVLSCTQFVFDCIVPVPLNKIRQRERGYNQVVIWGKLLSEFLRVPMIPHALIRTKNTVSQVTLSADKRIQNVRNAFSVQPEYVRGKNVLLLDDVITTGATLTECANQLKQGGAEQIFALTIARSSMKPKKSGGIYV